MSGYAVPPVGQKSRSRTPSAVGAGAGIAGFTGLLLWLAIARWYGLVGGVCALASLAACAIPMLGWSLLIDKVHRRIGNGINWANPQPWRATLQTSVVKLIGYWATWAAMALIYGTVSFYWDQPWRFAMKCFLFALPALVALSMPYVFWLDRRLAVPHDETWAFGAWLLRQPGFSRSARNEHIRIWAMKTFFLPLMLSNVPVSYGWIIAHTHAVDFRTVVDATQAYTNLVFALDILFGTVGYICTSRLFDTHIRSANPYASAWIAALVCYPPINILTGALLNYTQGGQPWSFWAQSHPWLLIVIAGLLTASLTVYLWATIAFGPRVSNLTNRGIITNGPYALCRHPAYVAKNAFWWLSAMPFLSTGSTLDAARSTLLLSCVSFIYYWRARTEERHLGQDEIYRDYLAWMRSKSQR